MGRSPPAGLEMMTMIKKGPWTPEEDRMLVDYIEIHGHGSWRALPKLAGLNRCGKSCRLRWTNYLRPDIRRGNFTEEEEKLIIHLHSLLGNKWSAIATRLSGRTDNEIKNYWNTHLKKKLLQMGIDPVTHQPLPTTHHDLHHLLLASAAAANLNLPQLLSLLLNSNTSTSGSTAGGNYYGMLINSSSSSSLNMDINNNININAALNIMRSRSHDHEYYPDANNVHFARAPSMVNYNLLLQFLSSPAAAASTTTNAANNISTTPAVPIIEALITGLLGPAAPLYHDDNHDQLLEYLNRLMMKNNPAGQPNQLLGLPDPAAYPSSSFPSLEELLQQCSTAAAAVTCNVNTNYNSAVSSGNYQLPSSGMSTTKPLIMTDDRIGLLTTGGGGGGSTASCSSSINPRFQTIPALVSAASLLKPNNIASTDHDEVIHDDDQTSGGSISKMKRPVITNHDDISRSNIPAASSTISTTLDGWEDRLMDDDANSDHDHELYWRDLIECNIACSLLPTGFNSKLSTTLG